MFLRFLLIGLLTAAIGEWQFSVFLRSNLNNWMGSLAFNALYLTGVYILTRLLLDALRKHSIFILIYGVVFGLIGLMVEWFLIGNSPWGNPQASQLGMFAYWASMVVVPLVFVLEMHLVMSFILRYAFRYIFLALLGQSLIANPNYRFAFHIYLVILGYIGLMLGIFWAALKQKSPSS